MNSDSVIEELYLRNERLVTYFLSKCNIFKEDSNYDDFDSGARYGLYIASRDFEEARGIKFSTFAGSCIYNEIAQVFRVNKKSKKFNSFSMDEILEDFDEPRSRFIKDPNVNVVEEVLSKDYFKTALEYLLNEVSVKQCTSILLTLMGESQHEVAQNMGVSQAQISRINGKVSGEFNEELDYKSGIRVDVYDDTFSVIFLNVKVQNFLEFFSNFLLGISQTDGQENFVKFEELPSFNLTVNEGNVNIELPKGEESFLFLALLVKKVSSSKNNGKTFAEIWANI